jgi:uncharacterized beta-barrel protein YwiB (DUF1934 family)
MESSDSFTPSTPSKSLKRPVQIRIFSEANGERFEQNASGEWYDKGNHGYLRYAETDKEMGNTVTTVRIEDNSVRVIRQGDVRSEQTFREGLEATGYYETSYISMRLATRTESITVACKNGSGSVKLRYRLLVEGEESGLYMLELELQPV